MLRSRAYTLHVELNQVLIVLFYCYVFSMPYELILELLFDIDTIFKPFRIISLLIIGVFSLKVLLRGFYFDKQYQADWFLYGVFAYGIFISLLRIIGGVFNMGLFYNDLFQSGLHVATFFIFKSIPISKGQGLKMFRLLVLSISLNAVYTFYNYINTYVDGRQGGFTDNPNYAALGIVAVCVFLILRTGYRRKTSYVFFSILLVFFLLYLFGVAGSRTGFVMFLVANVLIFLFSGFRRKWTLVVLGGLIVLLLLPGQLEKVSLGGPTLLVKRLSRSVEDGGEDVRFVVWRGAFKVFEDAGYMGMGIGQFKAKFSRYYGEESNKLILEMVNRGYYMSLHNDYLAILADYGMPSLIFYLCFLIGSFLKLLHKLNYRIKDPDQHFLVRLSFILFVCLILFGLTAENFQHQLYWFLLMFSTKNFE